MLRWRLILGIALIAALAAICRLDAASSRPGAYLAPVALVAGALATGEMLRMFRAQRRHPSAAAVYVGSLLPIVASGAPIAFCETGLPAERAGWLAAGLLAGLLVVFIGEMRRYDAPGDAAVNLGLAALSVLYVGGLIGCMVQLRLLPVGGGSTPSLLPLASLIGAVKLSDTCQYFVGKTCGRRKLAPKLSPGKTWEGTIGGIALASLATALWLPTCLVSEAGFSPQRSLAALVFAVAVSIAGLVGDLAESLLKRDSGVKDSSDWMPGFGGVLDLLDSLMFASPVALLFWASGWLAS